MKLETLAIFALVQKPGEVEALGDVHHDHKDPNERHGFPGVGVVPQVACSQREDHSQEPVHADEGDEDGAGADVVSEEHRDPDACHVAQRP